MEPVLVDTGPLVALLSQRDSEHARCVEVAHRITAPLVTTWPVLTEAAWLLRADSRAIDSLLRMVIDGEVQPVPLDRLAAEGVRAYLARYEDLNPQLADLTLLHLAEALGCDEVFTLDRRDFSVYRLSDGRSLKILPE